MTELILHHYPLSPFAEKVRRVLAYKRLPWRAVEQPIMAPKPHLTPLTGGYRRIPVLQLGADIYCDTALILRVLERLHPAPTIFPPAPRLQPTSTPAAMRTATMPRASASQSSPTITAANARRARSCA